MSQGLILNIISGLLSSTREVTEDGYELTFATNHLGHFLLTELLKPLLMKSSASGFHPRLTIHLVKCLTYYSMMKKITFRIVIVSALAHTHTTMNWDDLQSEKSYHPWKAYSQTKLANVLHAKHLATKLENTGITVYSLHPGETLDSRILHSFTNSILLNWIPGVIATEFSRNFDHWIFDLLRPIFKFVAKTPFYGAQTTLYCALDDTIECDNGLYYSDCREIRPSRHALIKEDQKKLWDLSENMVGIKQNV